MISLAIPNRPFATEPLTGMMLPDGIFEVALGKQRLSAHFQNTGGSPLSGASVYVESVSDPGIVFTPQTHALSPLAAGVAELHGWDMDFSSATPGAHRVSFIVEGPGGRRRIIKKIFVTKISYSAATRAFQATTPEGVMEVSFLDLIRPRAQGCGCTPSHRTEGQRESVLDYLVDLARGRDPDFHLCLPGYLPAALKLSITATPPFTGQYGDLPFQDPWWKVVLCVVAALLLLAAAIAESVGGSGDLGVTAGTPNPDNPNDCCGISATGGGTSALAAGLVAAAAAVATAAGLSDARDPIRRGQDHTVPSPGELTVSEALDVTFKYPEPVALGRPFSVGVKWAYTRVTTGNSYSHEVEETNKNIHVSEYDITAPDVVRSFRREAFTVQARFRDAQGRPFQGTQLYVQCFLAGPHGEQQRFLLQDNGQAFDDAPSDGVYTGTHTFSPDKDRGIWMFYVLAQDMNTARPDMPPEEAAQIIGGMVLTHQLTIGFEGGTCQLVPDGHVNVI